jgi:hypothetical protein
LEFCAKFKIPWRLAHGTGFYREAWRPALAESEIKNLKNIEENGEMALGQFRLM